MQTSAPGGRGGACDRPQRNMSAGDPWAPAIRELQSVNMSAPIPYFNSSENETVLFLEEASPSPSPDFISNYEAQHENVIHRCHIAKLQGLCHVKCMDYCVHAADDLCDDGGPGAQYAICELGTDCAQLPSCIEPPPNSRGTDERASEA